MFEAVGHVGHNPNLPSHRWAFSVSLGASGLVLALLILATAVRSVTDSPIDLSLGASPAQIDAGEEGLVFSFTGLSMRPQGLRRAAPAAPMLDSMPDRPKGWASRRAEWLARQKTPTTLPHPSLALPMIANPTHDSPLEPMTAFEPATLLAADPGGEDTMARRGSGSSSIATSPHEGAGAGGNAASNAVPVYRMMQYGDVVRIRTVNAEYPLEARQRNIEGDVILQVTCAASGVVIDVTWVSGPEVFRAVVMKAAWLNRYRPEPEPFQFTQPFSFRLF